MTEIVVNHFEHDGILQSLPRARTDAINELVPQLTTRSFDSLAHRRKQELMLRRILMGQQQYGGFFCQQRGGRLAAIAQIAQGNAAIGLERQTERRRAVSPVRRSQRNIDKAASEVAQSLQLKAEAPTLLSLAKVRALCSEQADAPLAQGVTQGKRLTIPQIKRLRAGGQSGRGGPQRAHLVAESMQPSQPLLVRAKLRQGWPIVIRNLLLSLLQTLHAQAALPQGDGQHFGVRKGRRIVGRVSLLCQWRMRFEKSVNYHVDFRQLIVYRRQRGRHPSGVEFCFATSFYTPLNG